jgi:hypothetical protein
MWKKIPYRGCVYLSVFLNVVSALIVFALKGYLPPVVPLFYGLPTGAEQLTPMLGLFLVPVVGLIITAINVLVSIFSKDDFLKKSLIISSVFISLLLTVTVIKIVLLVGFF